MNTPGDDDTPPVDEKTRERSAEERSVVAPTPRDVREKAENDSEPDDAPDDGSEEEPEKEADPRLTTRR
ncbi:hypothetical protein [Streptomyces geranii]|uniref:hypothetical protein n=1 Tax=Streptomyces geranii TaxID=2058923 RepID=UPI000D03ECDF|nr:hypothetical protein [Streptomyces geranii]